MSQSVTFLHSADLHLGAAFKGLRALSPVWADRLTKAIPDAFRSVIDTACDEQVDFVIFAGDVFDNVHATVCRLCSFHSWIKEIAGS